MPGFVPKSYPSRGEIVFKTAGRIKAINVHAAALMPNDCENKSILKPRQNEDASKSHPGVLKGRRRINIM